jgi:hypothetical protein
MTPRGCGILNSAPLQQHVLSYEDCIDGRKLRGTREFNAEAG